MNKKGAINEILVIVLLIVVLAVVVVLWLTWGKLGKETGEGLNNLFEMLWNK